ncbi:ArnT family glycosyltransferase [Singulisphaera sp. PoT]|uniref:ArnT family glycosyltransferase n=1 Tax=Singulisphaera sp. PoT TaxID=3411797 RepID=UPI003BF61A36
MADPRPRPRFSDRLASLAVALELGLALRVLAADVLEWFTRHKGVLCVFPDALYYWLLSGKIRDGLPYEIVEWGDIPHFALRTPGYPLFLAGCRILFGDRPIAARLIQAGLGALCAWLVYRLAAKMLGKPVRPRGWSIPLGAAFLTAIDPYFVATSVFLLSEALFVPLMLASLWGLAVLWTPRDGEESGHSWICALGTGFASGAAILVRPSWALFVPAMLLAWAVGAGRARWKSTLRGSVLVTLGLVAVMAPWWIRNAQVYGRFVPTAIWMGASLYDGLNPHADGASDMRFLEEDGFWPLDEETQDALLRRRAFEFALENPGRAAWLALVKFGRYWSPWPNADSFHQPVLAGLSALYSIPILGLLAVGAWDRRRDLRSLVILAGPIVYFCVLHMVFASSMRYRIPAAAPSMVLVALGLGRILARATREGEA